MRILVGLACLAGLFLLSSHWHRTRMQALRGEPPGPGTALAAESGSRPGWGEVVVGLPSGAEPVFLEPPPRAREGARRPEPQAGAAAAEPAPGLGDWELKVRSGDVLSRIVREHYGRVSPDLERRLAQYNQITHPDKLRVGQTLRLPPEERLVAATE